MRTAIHLLLTYLLTMLCNGYVTETRKLMSDPSADYTRLRQIPPDCRRLNSHRPTRHDKAVLSRCELALRTKPKNRKNNGKTIKKQVSVRRLSAESLIYLTDNDRLRENSKSTRELHRRSQPLDVCQPSQAERGQNGAARGRVTTWSGHGLLYNSTYYIEVHGAALLGSAGPSLQLGTETEDLRLCAT